MPGQRYIVKAPLRASEQASQAEESCGAGGGGGGADRSTGGTALKLF